MNLERNIAASYLSQVYITVLGVLLLPLYIKYMGPEAYGLVGVFAMLQAFLSLLDMGLTQTMSRESARFSGGATSVVEYRRLARTLEGIFCVIALASGLLLFALAEPISTHWLNTQHLPVDETITSLRLMALIVMLRLMSGFYRGVITGAERLSWLSGVNSAVATARFALVLPILMYVNSSPKAFFYFQLSIAIFEILALAVKAYRILPRLPEQTPLPWQWAPIKPLITFSISIAFTTSVWVLVTNIDKLLLSKLLSLTEYGYFTITVLLAGGIMVISVPISSALMPHMARLQAEAQYTQLIEVYRQGTQIVAVLSTSVAAVLAVFSSQILWAWTGDSVLVNIAAPVLTLYAVGYGFIAVSAFPYYLQYAKGNLSLHLIGSGMLLLLLVPSIIWATGEFGMIGAGWAWMISNAIYFLAWTPLVHRRLMPNLHLRWLARDIAQPAVPAIILAIIIDNLLTWSTHRGWLLLEIVVSGFSILIVSGLASKNVVRFMKRSLNLNR